MITATTYNITVAPFFIKQSAIAYPIPLVPPVIKATPFFNNSPYKIGILKTFLLANI